MSNNYAGKFVSAETAVKAVQPGDWVDYGFGAGFPELLDRALAARRDELTDVKIRGGLVIRPRIEVVESDPEQKAFSYYSWHIGDYERKLQTRGLCKFMPMMLRSLPEMYRHHIRVDVAFVPVSRPDADGCCGLGISNYAWRTIFENARTVIFEINERLPRLQGVDGSHRLFQRSRKIRFRPLFSGFFLLLDCIPIRDRFSLFGQHRLTKHVRMAADHFFAGAIHDLPYRKQSFFLRDLRVKKNLQH